MKAQGPKVLKTGWKRFSAKTLGPGTHSSGKVCVFVVVNVSVSQRFHWEVSFILAKDHNGWVKYLNFWRAIFGHFSGYLLHWILCQNMLVKTLCNQKCKNVTPFQSLIVVAEHASALLAVRLEDTFLSGWCVGLGLFHLIVFLKVLAPAKENCDPSKKTTTMCDPVSP